MSKGLVCDAASVPAGSVYNEGSFMCLLFGVVLSRRVERWLSEEDDRNFLDLCARALIRCFFSEATSDCSWYKKGGVPNGRT